MNKGYAVEYCNLELRFDREQIQDFIEQLIKEDFSIYWNETPHQFSIVIRSEKSLIRLNFERATHQYKLAGNYSLQDEKLAEMLEKLIGEVRGHAVVKRFKNKQVQIDNILFGEIIRSVELSQQDSNVTTPPLETMITPESVIKAWKNQRVKHRIPVLRMELDYELLRLSEAIQAQDLQEIHDCKAKLKELRLEMLRLEM